MWLMATVLDGAVVGLFQVLSVCPEANCYSSIRFKPVAPAERHSLSRQPK